MVAVWTSLFYFLLIEFWERDCLCGGTPEDGGALQLAKLLQCPSSPREDFGEVHECGWTTLAWLWAVSAALTSVL